MANVEIPLTIPSEYVALALESIVGLADGGIELRCVNSELDGRITFSYEPQQEGETTKDFAKRAIRKTIVALIKLFHQAEHNRLTKEAKEAVEVPGTDVPDEVIT